MLAFTRRDLLKLGAGAVVTSAVPIGAKSRPVTENASLAIGSHSTVRFAVPVPTPFHADLQLDLKAHRDLLGFYRRAGATAVLAVASTGEMLSLTWPEALQLTRQASAVFGPVGTWASLSRGTNVAACRMGIDQLAHAGAGMAIVVPGLLADGDVSDADALRRLLSVAKGSNLPLGLYEAIAPFHRLLQPEMLQQLAQVGGYRLLKTTQASAAAVQAMAAVVPSGFSIYEANTADLFAVLQTGAAAGAMDFCAAAFPELLQYLCQHWGQGTEASNLERICNWIATTDAILLNQLPFPLSVKVILQLRGAPILPLSRLNINNFSKEQRTVTADLVNQFNGLCKDLKIRSKL